jgi:hypothetical protein
MLIPAGIELADRIGLMDAIGLGGGDDYSPQQQRNMQTQDQYNNMAMQIAEDRYGREQQYVPSATDAIFEYANRMSNKPRSKLWGRGIFEPQFKDQPGQEIAAGQQSFQPAPYEPAEPSQPDLGYIPAMPSEVTYDAGSGPGSYGEWEGDGPVNIGMPADSRNQGPGDIYRNPYDGQDNNGFALSDEGDLYSRTMRGSDNKNAWAQAGAGTQDWSQLDANMLSSGGSVVDGNGRVVNPGFEGGMDNVQFDPKEYDKMFGAYDGARQTDGWANGAQDDPNAMINAPKDIVDAAVSVTDPSVREDLRLATSMPADEQLAQTGESRELIPVGGDYFIIRVTDAQGNVIRETPFGVDETRHGYQPDLGDM